MGISRAQAFGAANKRTVFQSYDTFLWINGVEFIGDPIALADWLVEVAKRSCELSATTDDFEAWLREKVKPR